MPSSQLANDRLAAQRRRSATPSLILVVDPETCAMCAADLALSGWAADGVADGREALAKAISCQPAVVITETRVPYLEGFELCRILKRDPDTRHIPILIVTSDAEDRQIAKASEAGADSILLKPFLPAELIRAIQALLTTSPESQEPPRSVRLPVGAPQSMSSVRSRSRLHQRGETTSPPSSPPALVCPKCDRPLVYQGSYIGGVNASHGEQWDDYECPAACGRFQYRQRTRKLRALV